MNTALKQWLLTLIKSAFEGGQLVIGKGTVPSPDTQVGAESVIAAISIPNDAWAVGDGALQLNQPLSGVASSAGTATFFRLVSNDGALVWQGQVVQGTTPQAGRLALNDTNFIQGQAVTVAFLEVSV